MPDVILNPFTGKLDFAGLSSTEADLLYISKDGTSTTTSSIPFAQGLNLPSGKTITFTDSGTGLDAFTIGSNGYSIPSKLTITSLGGTSPQFELIDTALYAIATDRMNVFGTAYTFTGVTNQDVNDVLVAYNSQSSTSGTIRGGQFSARFNGSSNSSGQNFGFNAIALHTGSGQLTRTTTAGGLCANRNRVIIDTGGSGTVSLACGVSSSFSATSGVSNTTSEFDGYRAELPSNGNNTLVLYAGLRVMGASLGSATLQNAYGVKIDQFIAGVTNYEIALDKSGGIYFNTPSNAGTENIKSKASGTLDFTAATSINQIIGSTTEVTVTANNMTFQNGATVTALDWTTSGQLDFQVGAASEMRLTANTLTFENGATDTQIDWATSGTLNLQVAAATELSITATQIDLGSATTDTVNFVSGADGTAPTLAGAVPTFTDYYGGNTNALGDPNSWLRIKRNGTTYRVPLYT